MIENNPVLSTRAIFGTRDYGPDTRRPRRRTPADVVETTVPLAQSTAHVDNFVGNWPACGAEARQLGAGDTLLKS
jgi:hypothetical protein